MAEAHPVGFRWVMKAKEQGATIIHVDPRFSRTSALSDIWVPIRAGTEIVFLGGLINHLIEYDSSFASTSFITRMPPASCPTNIAIQRTTGMAISQAGTKRNALTKGTAGFTRRGSESSAARSHVARPAMCLSEIKTAFLPLHAGDGRESLRHSA